MPTSLNQNQDIQSYGDFFGIEDVAAVEDVLRGVKYEREDVLKALGTIDITRYFAGSSREEIAGSSSGIKKLLKQTASFYNDILHK